MSALVIEALQLVNDAAKPNSKPDEPRLFGTDSDALAAAQTLALLEVAEQLRIGNLIALSKRGYSLDEELADVGNEAGAAMVRFKLIPATPMSGPDEVAVVAGDIKEGLGL